MFQEPYIWALFIVIASLGGLIFSIKYLRSWTNRMMPYLISLSAGVFLITAFQLITEGFHLDMGSITIGAAIFGFIVLYIIQKLLPESHHHHDDSREEAHSPQSAIKIFLADSIHNIGDGIVIAIAFSVNVEIGIFTTISIFVHELIQEISEYFVYRSSGYSIRKALTLNVISACTIFIGIFIGSILGGNVLMQAILLGIAGGMFLQVVFADLMPHPHHMERSLAMRHIIAFVLGAILILSIGLLIPHEHDHDEEYHDDDIQYISDDISLL